MPWTEKSLSRDHIREKKREALVQQAALEFRRKGYHATSMDDIALALGVTKGALYRYVKSKDEVLFECFMHSNRIGERAIEVAAKVDGDAATKLRSFMEYFIREYLDSNMAGGAMVEIDALLPEQRKIIVKGRDQIDAKLREFIADGIRDGTIVDENPKLMIFSFMGAINWIPSWFSPDGEYDSGQIAQMISRILVNGLRRHPGSA
jgi:TetR/AcrR family transcriptional regulator